ncbi:MAG: SMI1/KNR4 family protein [Paracoccaceae bacterium]
MFTIPDNVLAFWTERNAERQASGREPVMAMSAEDFRRIETVWGFPLPEAYKRFLSTYGPVEFPDGFSVFDYVGHAPDGGERVLQGDISCMVSAEALESAHRHLIADPDNETDEPFFPPNMLCFAGSTGTDQLLLELGTATPRVWFWEDSNDAFGRNDNRHLGFVAETFEAFIDNLRSNDAAAPAETPRAPVCQPQTTHQIDAIEQIAGLPLPASYREFLATMGQTSFDPPRQVGYEYPDEGSIAVSAVGVDEIFGHDTMRKALDHWWGPSAGQFLPPGFLPIGLGVGFQPLLLGFGGAAGIWSLSETVTHPWGPDDQPHLHLIRPDFESFVAALGRGVPAPG